MSSYTLTINSDAAARQKAADKGYNFVFAKGVSSGGDVDYNSAWIVLKPSEMSDSQTISWDVDYNADYSTEQFKDKAKIVGKGNLLKMDAGGQYVVSKVGELEIDPNRPPKGSAFHFHNDQGYALEYTPILSSLDNNNQRVAIWAASTGVSINGLIAATPTEVVRVWLGKYEQGESVLAEYATIGVEFDLTIQRSGTATINDTLSDWTGLSNNAHTFQPDINLVLPFADESIKDYLDSLAGGIGVTVAATFVTALTIAAITYLSNKLIDKFANNLKPKKITVDKKSNRVEIQFDNAKVVLATVGMDAYETAVDKALKSAVNDPNSGLKGETWKLSETSVTVSYT